MYITTVFWIFIFLSVVVQAVEKKLDMKPDYPLSVHMVNLESELQPDFAESTYVRVIVWNTMPTSEHLQAHFDKFDLLQLEEERLANGKFDIVQKSESTYERFLYAHYPEQQSFVTIFVKVDFNKKRNPSSLKNFIGKVNRALERYGLTNTTGTPPGPTESNDSSLLSASTVGISIFFSFIIYWVFIHPKTKKKGKQFEEFADAYLKSSHDLNMSQKDVRFRDRLKYVVDYENPVSPFITYEHSERVFYCLNKYKKSLNPQTELLNIDWNAHLNNLRTNNSGCIEKERFMRYIANLDYFKNCFQDR